MARPPRPSAPSRPALIVSSREAPLVPPTAPRKHLDVFDNPSPDRDYSVQFLIPEFTCHCPLTGQPDFAHFTIDVVPDRLCIELKSLKLYLWGYRDQGAFHEKVTNAILDDIASAARPRFARIAARWNVRGGIYTNIVAEYRKKGWKGTLPTPGAAASLPTMTG